MPRTADSVALTHVELYALDRTTFVEAVNGHAVSAEAADVVIGDHLSERSEP